MRLADFGHAHRAGRQRHLLQMSPLQQMPLAAHWLVGLGLVRVAVVTLGIHEGIHEGNMQGNAQGNG
jgi:hypothetical protein